MTRRHKSFSEEQILEDYKVALYNAVKKPRVVEAMARLGYNGEVIAKGQSLYDITRNFWEVNKTEDAETIKIREVFHAKYGELDEIHDRHYKLARIVFRSDLDIMVDLCLIDRAPRSYAKWLNGVKSFYSKTLKNTELQQKLARLNVTPEELAHGYKLIAPIEQVRAEYVSEMSESQDATRTKDDAFDQLDDWMSEFYMVAAVALEDNPELLESLDLLVRSC